MKHCSLLILLTLLGACASESRRHNDPVTVPTTENCGSGSFVTLTQKSFVLKIGAGEQKLTDLQLCSDALAAAATIDFKPATNDCDGLMVRLDGVSKSLFANPGSLNQAKSCGGTLAIQSGNFQSVEDIEIQLVVNGSTGGNPSFQTANLNVTAARVPGGYQLNLAYDPFLGSSRITNPKNTDNIRLQSVLEEIKDTGFTLDGADDSLDTATFNYSPNGNAYVLNESSAQFAYLNRWDRIVGILDAYQKTLNFTLADYDVTTDGLRPALLVKPLNGKFPTLGVDELLRGRSIGCFLSLIEGLKIPEVLKRVSEVKCENTLDDSVDDELLNSDFALSEKSYIDTPATGSTLVLRFGTLVEGLCQPSTTVLLDWQPLVPDYFAAGWVSRKDLANSNDFLAECRRYAFTQVIGKVSSAIKNTAVKSTKPYLNAFANKFIQNLALKNQTVNPANDQKFQKALLGLVINPDMTSLAVSFFLKPMTSHKLNCAKPWSGLPVRSKNSARS